MGQRERERARRLQRAAAKKSSAVCDNSAAPPSPSSFPKLAIHELE
jgi:hypothetical protein